MSGHAPFSSKSEVIPKLADRNGTQDRHTTPPPCQPTSVMSRAGLTAASMLFTIYISATEVSAAGCYVKSSSECDCKIAETDCGASVTTDKWTERCLCPATDKTYGKDIYYDKVNEHGLLSKCTHEYCLDRKTSRGSCYYMGPDTQIKPYIGHAVFCDVSEEECCGYLGCSAESYAVKMSNGG